jgi:hypothetical protein
MSPWKMTKYNADCYRIDDASGKVVALIEGLANGAWALFVGGKRVAGYASAKPKGVFDKWKANPVEERT